MMAEDFKKSPTCDCNFLESCFQVGFYVDWCKKSLRKCSRRLMPPSFIYLSTHNCTECVCWMSDISPRYRSLARPFHFRILAKICQLRNYLTMEASMAHWICLRLLSCRPGFDSQVPRYKIYSFFNLYLNCDEKRAKLNLKRPGLGHIFLTWITTFF